MMLNLSNLMKAPCYDYEVSMMRKPTVSSTKNARQKIAYVAAPNEADAKRAAELKNPAFKAGKTRRI